MTKNYKFAVIADTAHGTKYIVSRHMTLAAAQKAARYPGLEIISL
jgi:hypothetical protein